jgi:hypothetical protein
MPCSSATLARRSTLDEDRPKAPIVQMIGDLNRDFRARVVELDIKSMTDEYASLIVGEQTVTVRARRRRQVCGARHVSRAGEEPQIVCLRAKVSEERAQSRLILCSDGPHDNTRAIAQPHKLGCRRRCVRYRLLGGLAGHDATSLARRGSGCIRCRPPLLA